jgi:hypothetical protein
LKFPVLLLQEKKMKRVLVKFPAHLTRLIPFGR